MQIPVNYKNLKISKDFIKRKLYLKAELKTRVLKNLIRNQNTSILVKAWCSFTLTLKIKKRYTISLQEKRCLYTGKPKTIFKTTNMSRHMTKRFADLGLLQNIKAENY